MHKRAVSGSIILILVLNTLICTPVYGSEKSTHNNKAIVAESVIKPETHPDEEKGEDQQLIEAMERLDEKEYGQEDIDIVCGNSDIDPEVFRELMSYDFYITQVIEIAKVVKKYGLTDRELETYISALEKSDNMDREIHLALYFKDKEANTKTGIDEIKDLILKGYSMDNIRPAFRVAKTLNTDTEPFVLKDTKKTININSVKIDNRIKEKEKKSIEKVLSRYRIDEAALIETMVSQAVTGDTLISNISKAEESRGISSDMTLAASSVAALRSSEDFIDTKDSYNTYYNPPFYYRENNNEYISPSSGELIYERTDVKIPGRNGLNLNVTLRYNSGKAGMKQPLNNTERNYDTTNTVTPDDKHYEIGTGWSFNFSYLRIFEVASYPRDIEVHLGSGEVLLAGRSGSSSGNYYYEFEQYDAKDVSLVLDSSYTYFDNYSQLNSNSQYAIVYKDGRRELFNDIGLLVAIKDRYGNIIKFDYDWNETYNEPIYVNDKLIKYPLVKKITDSNGKIINIYYEINDDGNREMQIQASGRILLNYTQQQLQNEEYVINRISGYDPVNPTYTNFEYSVQEARFSFQDKDNTGESNPHVNLIKVEYPTGSYSRYAYEKVRGNFDVVGYEDYYRIKTRSDMIKKDANGTITFEESNKATYVFDKEKSDYPNETYENDPWDLPSTFTHGVTITDAANNQRKYTFNFKHQNTKEEFIENGTKPLKTIVYEYYLDKFPSKETTTYYNGTSSNRTTLVTRTYNEYGDLLDETDVLNRKTTYTYHPNFHILETVNKPIDTGLTMQITNTVSEAGNITATTKSHEENGTSKPIVTSYGYDSYGNMTSESIAIGDGKIRSITYGYPDTYQNALMTKKTSTVTDYAGNQNTISEDYTYSNSKRLLATFSDGNAKVTNYNYNYYDDIKSIKYPNVIKQDGTSETSSIEISRSYTDNHVIVTDECGNKGKYQYDGIGRLSEKQIFKDGAFIAYERTKYDSAGRVQYVDAIKDSGTTLRTSYQYDGLGRVTKITNNDGTYRTMVYDDVVNKVIETDEEGDLKETFYDNIGNVEKEVTYPVKNNTTIKNILQYQYNGLNKVSKIIDPKSKTTVFTYDDLGRLVSVTNAKQEVTKYKYDNTDNLIEIVDGNTRSTKYKYDQLGRLITTEKPDGSKEYCKYDAVGNLSWKKDRKGQEFAYRYDERNRLFEVTVGDKSILKNEYYANGKLLWEENSTGRRSFLYHTDGNILSITEADGKYISYEYDNIGNRTKMVDHFGQVINYEYDDKSRLDEVKAGTNTTGYDYYDNGSLKSVTYPGAIKEEYTYDGANNLKTLSNKNGQTVIDQYAYTYDGNGNQRSKTENGISTYYGYDVLNRVQTVSTTDAERPDPKDMLAAYTYDGAGNIESTFISSSLQMDAPINCVYNELNQLVEYIAPDGVKTTYTYYPNGLRKTKSTDEKATTYYYDGQNVIIEAENGSLKYRNIYGMNQISRQDTAGNVNYYLYNGHGDVVKTVDSAGNVMNSYEYDIYGKVISSLENGIPNPMRYAGQMYDSESGLYYLRARYYDPRVGRFISEDTNKGDINNPSSLNLYTYCYNNPLKYVDPSGHEGDLLNRLNFENVTNEDVTHGIKKTIDRAVAGFFIYVTYEEAKNIIRYGVAVAGTAAKNASTKGVNKTVFKNGDMFESKIITKDGIEIGGLADVEISGKTLTLKDISVYSNKGDIPNAVGARDIFKWQNEVAQQAKAQGFDILIIKGVRAANSTSANPGKVVEYTIDLTKLK